MQAKLKEVPREWLKFTAVVALGIALLGLLLYRRHIIGAQTFLLLGGGLVLVLITCVAQPRWFRGFYRLGMTLSFWLGQRLGQVLLTVFFLGLVTPLGCLLRLSGKDLLKIKRDRSAQSYWRTAKTNTHFDRQF